MGKISDFLNAFFGWETYAQRQERLYQKHKKKNAKKQSASMTEAESTPAPDVLIEQEAIFVRPAYERDFSCLSTQTHFSAHQEAESVTIRQTAACASTQTAVRFAMQICAESLQPVMLPALSSFCARRRSGGSLPLHQAQG